MHKFMKEFEACEHCQGVEIVHALSGGTGSGFTSLIMNNVVDHIPGVRLSCNSVFLLM
eukprot:UN30429